MGAITKAFSPQDRQVHVALVARNADEDERNLMTFCGVLLHSGAEVPEQDQISCPGCLQIQRYLAVGSKTKGLTVNGMVNMAYGTAKANGFHDKDHLPVAPVDPYGQIAGLSMVIMAWAHVAEAVRKPQEQSLDKWVEVLLDEAKRLQELGPEWAGANIAKALRLEPWQMRLLAWLGLQVTELAEAMEAVIKKDRANFAEELADTKIRIGDTVGAINDDSTHPFSGIDLEEAILAKNERNKTRGYRHGGKRA